MNFLSCCFILFMSVLAFSAQEEDAYNEPVKRVIHGQVYELKDTIEKNRELLYETWSNRLTLLHYAVIFEQHECVETILEMSNGLNVNAQDSAGLTPLHYAVTHSKYLVELLVLHRADPYIKAHSGFTAIDLCSDPDILRFLE